MNNIETTIIENRKKSRLSDFSGTGKKNGPSKYRVISIFVESALTGFSLFSGFLIQKMYFDLQNHQFLIGQGELIRMSIGIAFCYAFISVLRRGYLSRTIDRKRETVKQAAGFVVESYALYLALLFLVVDVNFKSVKLALGIGFLVCMSLIFLYRLVLSSIFAGKKIFPEQRSIILKKPPLPSTLREQYHSDRKGKIGVAVSSGDDTRFGELAKENFVGDPIENPEPSD